MQQYRGIQTPTTFRIDFDQNVDGLHIRNRRRVCSTLPGAVLIEIIWSLVGQPDEAYNDHHISDNVAKDVAMLTGKSVQEINTWSVMFILELARHATA